MKLFAGNRTPNVGSQLLGVRIMRYSQLTLAVALCNPCYTE